MKRFFLTISVFFAVLAVLYSGFWLYQSRKVKVFAVEYVTYLTKKFGGESSQFIYSDTRMKGFPLAFNVEISNPKFIFQEKDVAMEVSSEEPLVFGANVIGSKFNTVFPKNINVHKGAADSVPLLVKFVQQPNVVIKIKHKGLLPWLLKGADFDSDEPPLVVRIFSYTDKGFSVVKSDNGAEIASGKSNEIGFSLDKEDNQSLKVDCDSLFIDKLLLLPEYTSGLGSFNVEADISYKRPDGDNVGTSTNITKLVLGADSFSLDVKGNIDRSDADALPFGGLQIKLVGYESFVDYGKALINYVVANSAFPIFSIKDEQADTFKDFLKVIASEKYNDDKDILIVFNRKKGEDFRIGELGVYDALQMFKADMATPRKSAPKKVIIQNLRRTADPDAPAPVAPEASGIEAQEPSVPPAQ
jgi:hypothetical protein